MSKPVLIGLLLVIPVTLLLAGWYYEMDILISIGAIFLIFYILMVIRGKFSQRKN